MQSKRINLDLLDFKNIQYGNVKQFHTQKVDCKICGKAFHHDYFLVKKYGEIWTVLDHL